MWCIVELNEEYIERMEDLLNLYEKPLNPKEPVVCLDEKPVTLHDNYRKTIDNNMPGKILKRDYEYIRKGTCNVFCIIEPKAGRHLPKVTKNRISREFAKVIKRIHKKYLNAKKIHLVLDNLNTHKEKSLIDYYGKQEGKRLWRKFKIHYTPKHASWLNQAEIEISSFSRQCLGKRRIGDIKVLKRITDSWSREMNKEKVKIFWKFTVAKARKKFKYTR